MNSNKDSYAGIVKSTFLFGFVQVFNILSKVGINKAVAFFLGTEGMGVISLYQSTINLLKTGFELGISQSAVRDISQSLNNSRSEFSNTIGIVKRIILYTSSVGCLATLILSPWLSRWTFEGSSEYTYAFMWLSVVVFLNIITEGQLGILKGTRQLRALAKASLMGSVVGLLGGVPLYWILGDKGIVPSLLVSALAAVLFSYYYVSKVDYDKTNVSTKVAFKNGSTMMKMGIALMYVSFLGVLTDYIIRVYISNTSDINMVGLFQAGSMVITSYFGIVITALTTDYYPRISAINTDNKAIGAEFNKQCEVGLLMIVPLVVIFMFAQHFLVVFLYTDAFLPTIDYMQYATFGVFIMMICNAFAFILLAKNAIGIYFVTATISRLFTIPMNLLFFDLWGLKGLGVSYVLSMTFYLLILIICVWFKYKIRMRIDLLKMFMYTVLFSVLSYLVKDLENIVLKLFMGVILTGVTFYYTWRSMKRIMGINLLVYLKFKI